MLGEPFLLRKWSDEFGHGNGSRAFEKDDMREGYTADIIRSGVRGKYAQRYREGSNVVVSDPELSKVLPNADAVNEALREVLAKRESEEP